MTRICRGICKRTEIKNYLQIYHEGLKRCSKCDIFFKTERYFCSCCGTAMRSKPRVSRKKVEHIRI
jgi:hypothetical protein